jgi:hypothetical protein
MRFDMLGVPPLKTFLFFYFSLSEKNISHKIKYGGVI